MLTLNGPVSLVNTTYVTRPFEAKMLGWAVNREWVLVIGPRQHGKTSALLRLRRDLAAGGILCAFVDLQNLPPGLEFSDLLKWFAKSVAKSLAHTITNAPDDTSSLASWLTCAIPESDTPVAIIIDEASAIRDDGQRVAFYSQIRAFKTARETAQPEEIEARLQFVFSGTFIPERMIDDLNSPFNVCRDIEPEDFTEAQLEEIARSVLSAPLAASAAKAIFQRAGGQPHLAQVFLEATCEGTSDDEVVAAIDERQSQIEAGGSDHTDSLFRLVVKDPALTTIVGNVSKGGKVWFDPTNGDYKYICVIGLMKRSSTDLVFRNDLFAKIAANSPQLFPENVAKSTGSKHFFARDAEDLRFVKCDKYREIALSAHNGAVVNLDAKHYRLCFIAAGVSLEAILIDVLEQQTPAALAAGVAKRNQQQRNAFQGREIVTAPATWRLVNLIATARLMLLTNNKIDVPDTLREMRNFVHPAEMKRMYHAEASMEPEAMSALALLSAVIRDLS